MTEYGIIRGLVQKFDTNSQRGGQYFELRKMVRDYLNKFHVPFYDPCCPNYDTAALNTVGYSTTGGIQYYDESSETWVSVASASSVTALTAFATGGQTSGTALSPGFNEVTVAATAGDSVKLPTAVEGLIVTVKNNGAAAIDVFPFLADSINTQAVNLAVSIPPGAQTTFTAINGTIWEASNQVISTGAVTNAAGTFFGAFYPNAAQNDVAAGTGGAIIVTNYLTTINTDAGGDAFTLANGTQTGQMKKILLVVDGGGDGVVTPATAFAGGATTATFGDAADFLILMWNGSAWRVLENSGVTVA